VYQVPQRPRRCSRGSAASRYWGDRKPPKNLHPGLQRREAEKTTGEGSSADRPHHRHAADLRPDRLLGRLLGRLSAKEVAEALDQLGDVDEIVVRVNSPGGDAWEGMAILNMLRAHKAEVTGGRRRASPPPRPPTSWPAATRP
jgi:hypothetical protein